MRFSPPAVRMRRLCAVAAVVAAAAAAVPAAARVGASLGRTAAGTPPAAVASQALAADDSGDRSTDARTGPRLQDELVRQLDAAAPDDTISVMAHAADAAAAAAAVRDAGLETIRAFAGVGVVAARGPATAVRDLAARPELTFLEANRQLAWHMATSHRATRGEEALTGSPVSGAGVSGAGVTVAVIDSGVDPNHPMFQRNGRSKVVRNLRVVPLSGSVVDAGPADTDGPSGGGHGTHVSGTAAGSSVLTVDGRKLHGAAPGASLVVLGTGAAISVLDADTALDWVLHNHAAPCGPGVPRSTCPPIRVINNSYGPTGGSEFDPESTTAKLQDALVRAGVVVVWSAGNGGGDGGAVRTGGDGSSPTPGVLSVANYDDWNSGDRNGDLAVSSSRGLAGVQGTYPDLAAPGTEIVSACRSWMAICHLHAGAQPDPNYASLSGTSMAAPHVSGIVAQLFQVNPALTPADIERILEATAHKLTTGAGYEPDPRHPGGATSFDKGHGLVDAAAAVAAARAQPATGHAVRACEAGGVVAIDVPGDAAGPANGETAAPSEPALDLRRVVLGWSTARRAPVFRVQVVDLQPTDPPASNGLWFDIGFTHAGRALELRAQRVGMAVVSFSLRTPDGTTIASGLEGRFDAAADLVSIILKPGDLAGAGLPPVTEPDRIGRISVDSYRIVGAVGIGTDRADAHCDFIPSSGAVPPVPPGAMLRPKASVTLGAPALRWTGGPFLDATLGPCTTRTDAACDNHHLQVEVPPGGATLRVKVVPEAFVDDFDLVVYGPDGIVDQSGRPPGETEVVVARVFHPGVYTVQVTPFATAGGTYDASVDLVP